MAQTQSFNGRRRVRKFFGKIPEVAEMPNLIEVQKGFLTINSSWLTEPEGGRSDEAYRPYSNRYFRSRIFPVAATLDFVSYEFEARNSTLKNAASVI